MSSSRAMMARAQLAGLGIAITLSTFAGGIAQGQTLPQIASREVQLGNDTGPLKAPVGTECQVLSSIPVTVLGAKWLRIKFGETTLAGDAAANGTTLRIMSAEDGAVQFLNAEALKQWGNTSAYFNGDTVTVDVVGFPGSGESRVVVESVTAGDGGGYAGRSLCGSGDDRVLSSEPGNARLLPAGCTAFMINDANRMFLTAGHCNVNAATVIEFNVPPSNADGTIVHPSPQDQYPVDGASVQSSDGGIGDDWCYFGVWPNSNTHMTPAQVQSQNYNLANSVRNPGGSVRVTGYGVVAEPTPRERNMVQKTHSGPWTSRTGTILAYQVDTTGGNSGSPVVDLLNGDVIGIHTNAGCENGGSGNQGTSIENPGLRNALANPRGVCASGTTPPGGGATGAGIFAVGDSSNNFGSFASGGSFTGLAQVGPSMQGMAYDRNSDRFIAIDSNRGIYSISASGTVVFDGTLVGANSVINGLGYDPDAQTMYGISQSNGQLYQIFLRPMIASPLGSPRGGNVGALDFDPEARVLYGISDVAGGSRLVRISVTDGSQTAVGQLGSGINDCNGLAYNPNDGMLYTINASTQDLLMVNPQTGVATVVGRTNGVFGASYGMAAREVANQNCVADFNHDGEDGTDADIEAFFAALAGNPCQTCGSVDYDNDGDVGTDFDIEAFFRAIAGNPC